VPATFQHFLTKKPDFPKVLVKRLKSQAGISIGHRQRAIIEGKAHE
jgi:hypothetical protein